MAEEQKKEFQEEKLIGKVTHYFNQIKVAVIALDDKLEKGETIRIKGGETDFIQEVESIESERQKIEKAQKGDIIGLKVKEKVREGYKVYKLS